MIRIGTVGTGFIVDHMADAISRVDGMEIAAVYSRTEESAKAFAEKHGVKQYYWDKDAFLNDESLDFIYVASPNSLHFQWSSDALNAGRNVICEKPFVSNLAETETLCDLARSKGLYLFEALTTSHLPNYQIVREQLPKIGNLKLIQLNFSQYSSRYKAFIEGKNPNVFNPEFSGGALMDINYYNFRFVLDMFGEPKDIKYFPNIAPNGIDTSGVLVMTYEDFVVSAVGAKDSRSENFTQIQGDQGFIKVPQESSRCLEVIVTTADGQESYNQQSDGNALVYEMVDFARIYREQDRAKHDALLEETRVAMKWLEKARVEAGIRFGEGGTL